MAAPTYSKIYTDATELSVSSGTWAHANGYLSITQAGGADWANTLARISGVTVTAFDALVEIKKLAGNCQVIFRSNTTAASGYGIQLRDTNTLQFENWGASNLQSVTSLTWGTGTKYNIRIRAVGTSIKAKVWVVGTDEPASWAIDDTDGTFSSGGFGYAVENTTGDFIKSVTIYDSSAFGAGDIFPSYVPRSKRVLIDKTTFSGINFSINLSGGEFNSHIAGTIDTNYTFYDNSEYASIATHFPGSIIRLPTTISRLCPTIGTVNTTKGNELLAAMTLAGNNGLRVLVDLHDYGAKQISEVQRRIGSAEYTQANYVSDITAVANYIKDHSALWGICISNEPNSMPVASDSSNYATATWTLAANAACAAVKGVKSTIKTTVCTDNYSGAQVLVATYLTNPFTNADYIELHLYFDSDNSGSYDGSDVTMAGAGRTVPYAGNVLEECAAWARSNNAQIVIGEVGIKPGDAGYLQMLNGFYQVAAANTDVIKGVFHWAKRTGWYISASAVDVSNRLEQMSVIGKYRGTGV